MFCSESKNFTVWGITLIHVRLVFISLLYEDVIVEVLSKLGTINRSWHWGHSRSSHCLGLWHAILAHQFKAPLVCFPFSFLKMYLGKTEQVPNNWTPCHPREESGSSYCLLVLTSQPQRIQTFLSRSNGCKISTNTHIHASSQSLSLSNNYTNTF